MTEPPAEPPGEAPRGQPDDDWDDDWDADWDERRVLGMQPRTALWVIMTVGVAAAIIAIVVVALTGSGGNGGQPQAGTGVPSSSLSPSQGPPGEVTCAVISADPNLRGVYTFVTAPLDPPKTAMPAVPPTRQCTGTPDKGNAPDVVALIWPGLQQDTYRQVLTDAGWRYDDIRGDVSFFNNPGSAYEIALLEVNDALVALYDQG